jgi:hypothetical protein
MCFTFYYAIRAKPKHRLDKATGQFDCLRMTAIAATALA